MPKTTPASRRDEYVAKMKVQLDELNARIGRVEARALDAKADARDRYDAEVAKLRHQSQLAKARLDELRAAGEDRWEAMTAEMDKVRDAFKHAFNYFKSQL